MISPITSKVTKQVPYIGLVIQGVGIALDNKETIESLVFYAAHLGSKTLNVVKDRSTVRSKFLDEPLEKGKSIDIENYDLIDFNINSMINKD